MTAEAEQSQNRETEPTTRPQIWVGSLSDYNAGILHGEWMDAAREPEDVHDDITSMLGKSPTAAREALPAEEWAIFDYEGFGSLRIDEYESIDRVTRFANGIVDHGLAFAAWASMEDHADSDYLNEAFEDAYRGRFDSTVDYVDQFVEDMGYDDMLDKALPAGIRPYVRIQTDQLARDLELSGDIYTVRSDDGGIWLFEGVL